MTHQKLRVYQLSLTLLTDVHRASELIPRGHRPLADQLLRAMTSVVLNIGEGANKFSRGAKRNSYQIALGELGEAAVALEVATTLGWLPAAEGERLLRDARRASYLLARLLRSQAA